MTPKTTLKMFYKRAKHTKNTITTAKTEDGKYIYLFESLWLVYNKRPQLNAVKLKEFKDVVLWGTNIVLSEESVEALSIAVKNKHEFEGKTIKMKLK